MDELGQRAGAQADQQHPGRPRRGAQQQPGHHLAGVFELEGVGLAQAHRALHPVGAEVQVADAGFFADVDGGVHGRTGVCCNAATAPVLRRRDSRKRNMSTFENFNHELASIDMEIARLAQLCGIHLLQPGVAEAVLRGDSSLCNSTNPLAWDKLRGLLVLHYHVVQEAAATDGVDAAAEGVRQALESVSERMRPVQQ
jgi:hypothetical protein